MYIHRYIRVFVSYSSRKPLESFFSVASAVQPIRSSARHMTAKLFMVLVPSLHSGFCRALNA